MGVTKIGLFVLYRIEHSYENQTHQTYVVADSVEEAVKKLRESQTLGSLILVKSVTEIDEVVV